MNAKQQAAHHNLLPAEAQTHTARDALAARNEYVETAFSLNIELTDDYFPGDNDNANG